MKEPEVRARGYKKSLDNGNNLLGGVFAFEGDILL